MAKFSGVIGYAIPVETTPGVWKDQITERKHYGETQRDTNQWSPSSNSTNDNLNIANQISIVADPFAKKNSRWMRYVEFMGTKWKITRIEVQYPRLILTVGGVYNGK